MKTPFVALLSDQYVSPAVIEYAMQSEGVLCASGAHDSLTEDDEWADLLE